MRGNSLSFAWLRPSYLPTYPPSRLESLVIPSSTVIIRIPPLLFNPTDYYFPRLPSIHLPPDLTLVSPGEIRGQACKWFMSYITILDATPCKLW